MTSRCSLFDENTLSEIFSQAKRIAAAVPFRVQGTDEFYDLLNSFGCRIEGETVTIPASVVDIVVLREYTIRRI